MKIDKLLSKLNVFLKLARLKYDPSIFEEMRAAIDHCIAVRHLKDLKEKIIEVDESEEKALTDKCQQLLTPSYQRYNLKIARGNSFYWSRNTVTGWKTIHLITFFNEEGRREKNIDSEERSVGLFVSSEAGGIVYMDLSDDKRRMCSDVGMLESLLSEVHSILQHELRHKTQMDYKKEKSLDEWGGLPGKKYRHPDTKVDWDGSIEGSDRQISHPLRDIEFYPNLMSAVDNFCYIYGDASPEELKEIIKIRVCNDLDVDNINYSIEEYSQNFQDFKKSVGKWTVYPSVLFYAWKKYGGEMKWRKGVTEFVKAVESKLSQK